MDRENRGAFLFGGAILVLMGVLPQDVRYRAECGTGRAAVGHRQAHLASQLIDTKKAGARKLPCCKTPK